MRYIVVYDVETTGLSASKHMMCELGAVAIDTHTLEIVDEYESVIAPYQVISGYDDAGKPVLTDPVFDQKALAVNGLSVADIEAGNDPKSVVADFIRFLEKHKVKKRGGKPILCGHNIGGFDNDFLVNFFEANKKDLQKYVNDEYIDTLVWSRSAFPVGVTENVDNKLGTTCQHVGVDLVNAHRALSDVYGNAGMVIELLKRMRGTSASAGSGEGQKKKRVRDGFKF